MKVHVLIVFCFLFITYSTAQSKLDSLYNVWLDDSKHDTVRGKALNKFIWRGYLRRYPDSAEIYGQKLLKFSKEKEIPFLESSGYDIIAISYDIRGNTDKALEFFTKGLEVNKRHKRDKGIATSYMNLGIVYRRLGEYDRALENYHESIAFFRQTNDQERTASGLLNVGAVYASKGEFLNALKVYKESLKIYKEIENENSQSKLLTSIGQIFQMQGSYPRAIDYYKKALKINEKTDDKFVRANIFNNIGILYDSQENYEMALKYNDFALQVFTEIQDKSRMSSALTVKGNIHKNLGDLDKAMDYYEQCLILNREMKDKKGIAGSLHGIGTIDAGRGKYFSALNYYKEALVIYNELEDKESQCGIYNNIGEAFYHQGKYRQAIDNYLKSLQLAQAINSFENRKITNHNLYKSFKALDKNSEALKHHEMMLVITDSLESKETTKKLQRLEFEKQLVADSLLQIEKDLKTEIAHKSEIRRKNRNKNIALASGVFFLFLSGGFYSRWRYVRKSKAIIEKEKDRSENLLLNILPSEIAEELKEKGRADARDFDTVSILFTDFKGFTQASEKLSAQDLVTEINHCFKAFDHICEKHGIEKIKTIGDAYMAAGGLPIPSSQSVKNTVLAGLEMQRFMSNRIKEKLANNDIPFEMRVGIHTGPVVAGIVGVKKFQYDVWGDTVNTASRMESSGEIGKVNISQDTFELIKDDISLEFQARGKINAKGKGQIKMYFTSLSEK